VLVREVLNTARMKETAVAVESSLESARLEQFRTRLAGPLAVVGSGGSFTTAALWAYLHESAGYPAWAMTPYAFAESRLPAGTRVLLLSAGGNHHDIIRTADLALRRGCGTLAMTCRPESALATRVARGSSIDAVLVVPEPVHADGLIAVHGLVAFAVLAARIYAGPGPWASCFDVDASPMPEVPPRFVVAFGGGAAAPAAIDFANKCQEAGIAPAWQTDVRHFAHGQWMMLHLAGADMLLVAFATRSQREYLERFAAALPASIPQRRIDVDDEGAPAALSLLARAMRSFDVLASRGHGAPTLETIPAWCRDLYELEP